MQQMETTIPLDRPFSLRQTLLPLRHGAHDPCVRFDDAGFWRATRTPEGPATLLLQTEPGKVRARAWGDGAQWLLSHVPQLIGEHQLDATFAPSHPVVKDLLARHPGLRIPRTNSVFEALVPSILEQRVTGMEAKRSYAMLVRSLGEAAPGPSGSKPLRLPPDPKTLASTPSWSMHRMGVERKRAETIRIAARHAVRLEEATAMSSEDARRRLLAIPGIGPWTMAEVATVALGDSDAVSVGDYHLPNWVAWALANEPRGDDRRMLELLAPFKGQRALVIRLIALGHSKPPKFGPRYSPLPISSM